MQLQHIPAPLLAECSLPPTPDKVLMEIRTEGRRLLCHPDERQLRGTIADGRDEAARSNAEPFQS
jgi:hypothetical protein